ncbi:hypothetical protein HPB48_019933 [Haemaphysalis longicornis]|uniref:Uncharacterized protein n=1 Tax=Haemaphysalis longicornis TaxID=44386 RepID=A0A9J6FVP5_HAELO|nr:hypothetical protein HPB48_019933 [Haemaphysalis longicornis]
MWAGIEYGLKNVYLSNEDMSRAQFMELYTRLCDYASPKPLDCARKPGTKGQNFPPPDSSLHCDLFERIKDFLNDYLDSLRKEGIDLMDEDFLTFYLCA